MVKLNEIFLIIKLGYMRNEHKDIQKWIRKKYSHKYDVFAEEVDGKNMLPNRKEHTYEPDVLIKAKKSVKIVYIVEVENDPMRKGLVGASVLADYSIGKVQKTKPVLIFIIYTEEGIKQIKRFILRGKIAKKYCKHIKDIRILTQREFEKYKL